MLLMIFGELVARGLVELVGDLEDDCTFAGAVRGEAERPPARRWITTMRPPTADSSLESTAAVWLLAGTATFVLR